MKCVRNTPRNRRGLCVLTTCWLEERWTVCTLIAKIMANIWTTAIIACREKLSRTIELPLYLCAGACDADGMVHVMGKAFKETMQNTFPEMSPGSRGPPLFLQTSAWGKHMCTQAKLYPCAPPHPTGGPIMSPENTLVSFTQKTVIQHCTGSSQEVVRCLLTHNSTAGSWPVRRLTR